MVELDTMLSLLQTASIIIGVFYYIMTLQNSNKTQQLTLEAQQQSAETRQAQLFMQIYGTWSSREFIEVRDEYLTWEWTDYEDFMEKYMSNTEASTIFSQAACMFEGIGVLIKRELIAPSMVDDLMSGATLTGWEKFGSVVRERRVRENKPYYFEFWEYLYDEVSAIAHKQHPELEH